MVDPEAQPIDAYATFADYQGRQTVTPGDSDPVGQALVSASRQLDRELKMMPRGFGPIDEATFYFESDGGPSLYLLDGDASFPLRTVSADGIRPDYDHSGDHDSSDYAWDLADVFVWPRPRNAQALGYPYRRIDLRALGNAPITSWPYPPGTVRITGTWGWPEVPPPIRDITVYVARQMRDTTSGGAAQVLAQMEDGVGVSDTMWRLWLRVKREYHQGDFASLGL